MISKLAGAGLMAILAGGAAASTVLETSAGDTLATAQWLPTGTTAVEGEMSVDSDVDMYRIDWAGGAFSASVADTDIDPQLFMFDSAGFGVAANDDGGPSFSALLSFVSLGVGTYYLAVTDYGSDPVSPGGFIFPDAPNAQYGPTGPGGGQALSGWDAGGDTGDYRLELFDTYIAPAAVPLPSSALLMLPALTGLGALRARKRRQAR